MISVKLKSTFSCHYDGHISLKSQRDTSCFFLMTTEIDVLINYFYAYMFFFFSFISFVCFDLFSVCVMWAHMCWSDSDFKQIMVQFKAELCNEIPFSQYVTE